MHFMNGDANHYKKSNRQEILNQAKFDAILYKHFYHKLLDSVAKSKTRRGRLDNFINSCNELVDDNDKLFEHVSYNDVSLVYSFLDYL